MVATMPVVRVACRACRAELARERRGALDDDAVRAVPVGGRPLGGEVGGHAVDVLDDDGVAPVDDADGLEAHRADGAGLDRAGRDLERAVGGALLVGLADLVELDAELGRRPCAPAAPTRSDCTPGIAMMAGWSSGLPKPNTSNIMNVTG